MKQLSLLLLAKSLRGIARLKGGHGSALPGYVIEKLDRSFLPWMLGQLPLGVVVVTGTNGKTTTTRMLVQLLRDNELRVLTNASGSNLTRGLISTVIEHSTAKGKLPYDIAVFELDEAYAPIFASMVKPHVLVALNVLRDQLDRYGEIDTTASLIAKAGGHAKQVVANGNDPLLMSKLQIHPVLHTFGLAHNLEGKLSSEANLYSASSGKSSQKAPHYDAEIVDIKSSEESQQIRAKIVGEQISGTLPLLGTHNALNAVVAILATKTILPKVAAQMLIKNLEHFRPAFGRGESMKVQGRELTVALIKNPSGFTQNVNTFVRSSIDAILIVINDEYADGRDVSWLWDSHIAKLKEFKGVIYVGGTRRYDMALCLKYQGIEHQVIDAKSAGVTMRKVMRSSKWQRHLLVIPTYTAMLAVRKWLGVQQGVKHIW